MQTLAKIQVAAIFLIQDMRKNFLPRFIETNMAVQNREKHLSLSWLQKRELTSQGR